MKSFCLAFTLAIVFALSFGHSANADVDSSPNIAAVHLAAASPSPADAGQADVVVPGPKDNGVIITKAVVAVPVDPTQDAPGWVAAWLAGVKGGNYWWAAASLLMAAMLVVRKIKPSLFDSDIAGTTFTFGLSFLGAILTSGIAKKAPDASVLKAAFYVALMAAGGWSVLWKRFALPLLQKIGVIKPDAPKP